MRIVLFTPYGYSTGIFETAATALHLFAAYLRASKAEITKIICDGCYELCLRDLIEKNARRSCSVCQKEQFHLAEWAKLKTVNFSNYITSADLIALKKEKSGFKTSNFQTKYELNNQELVDNAKLTFKACDAIFADLLPDLVLTAGKDDYVSAALKQYSLERGVKIVSFDGETGTSQVEVKRLWDNESFSFEVLLPAISKIRPELTTWSSEIVRPLQQCVEFLGLYSSQLTLPLGRK